MFFTIQGEGPFAGHRAVFIRLAGCNLQCPGCDTEYTKGRDLLNTHAIAIWAHKLARDNDAEGCLMVITGGEPLRQTIGGLVSQLADDLGHPVQIESNGFFAPDDYLVQLLEFRDNVSLVVSPKTHRIHPECERLAAAFKYVLDYKSVGEDGLPIKALGHPAPLGVARPRPGALVYVNPYDSGDPIWNAENLQAAAESAKRFGYILGVQLHKLIGYE